MAPEEATAATVAQAAVSALRREASAHKRSSEFHRGEAQRIMQAREKLIKQLLAAGIEVEIDGVQIQKPEAMSHGHERTSP